MSIVYIVQKDLPNGVKGEELYYKDDESCKRYETNKPNKYGTHLCFTPNVVENNPEWFLPKQEGKREVMYYGRDSHKSNTGIEWYSFMVTKLIPPEKYKAISKAIETVINYEKIMIIPCIPEMGWRIDIDLLADEPIKVMFSKEDLEKAFYAGRDGHIATDHRYPQRIHAFETFNDYFNYKK